MFRPKVTTLYKYLHIDKYSLATLESGQVWCSKPAKFNDPFDSQYSVGIFEEAFTQDRIRELFEHVYGWTKAKQRGRLTDFFLRDGTLRKTIRKRMEQRVEQLRACGDMGVFCLTEDSNNVLMWSHYAKDHKGMCIGFQRTPENALGDDGICLPVTYTNQYLTADTIRIFLRKNFSPVTHMMRTKSHHWKYEKEWRLFSEVGDALAEAPGRIHRVILGSRTSTRARNRVLKILDGRDVELYRSTPVEGKFQMRMERI